MGRIHMYDDIGNIIGVDIKFTTNNISMDSWYINRKFDSLAYKQKRKTT